MNKAPVYSKNKVEKTRNPLQWAYTMYNHSATELCLRAGSGRETSSTSPATFYLARQKPALNFPCCRVVGHKPSYTIKRKTLLLCSRKGSKVEGKQWWIPGWYWTTLWLGLDSPACSWSCCTRPDTTSSRSIRNVRRCWVLYGPKVAWLWRTL